MNRLRNKMMQPFMRATFTVKHSQTHSNGNKNAHDNVMSDIHVAAQRIPTPSWGEIALQHDTLSNTKTNTAINQQNTEKWKRKREREHKQTKRQASCNPSSHTKQYTTEHPIAQTQYTTPSYANNTAAAVPAIAIVRAALAVSSPSSYSPSVVMPRPPPSSPSSSLLLSIPSPLPP